jgi:hypothetical protein
MKSRPYWIVALCASVACVVLPAHAADGADKKKDVAPHIKPLKAATPASSTETAADRDSAKLKSATDRRAKAMETTSNVMKKSSETSDSIIKNTK